MASLRAIASPRSLILRMHVSRRTVGAIILLASLLVAPPAPAQRSDSRLDPAKPEFWWLGGALVLAAAATDEAIERHSLAHRSASLTHMANVGDQLGTGRTLMPALALSYLTGRLARQRGLTETVTHTAAAYVLGDIALVGKPLFGRHRPDTVGSAWRFRPFSTAGEWHSLPSGHTMHAFTLASAIAEEAGRPWVTVVSYGLAALVGWSRTYDDEHWGSDVVLSAFVGTAIGRGTVRWLHGRSKSPPVRLRGR